MTRKRDFYVGLPLHAFTRDWWNNFTILTDTPEKRSAREKKFQELAVALLFQGRRALGDQRAKEIWLNVSVGPAHKIRGKADKPDEHTRLLHIYDGFVSSSGAAGARAKAVKEFLKTAPQTIGRQAVEKRLDRLLKERKEKRKKESELHARWIELFGPTLLGSTDK